MGGKAWTEDEIIKLQDMAGTYTVATIAKKLGRSFNSVNCKIGRMGLSGFEKSTDFITMHQLCLMFGVESRTVKKKWKSKGLRIMKKGYYIVIRQENLVRYLKEHPEDWNATKVTDDSLIMAYPWYKAKKRSDTRECYHWSPEDISRLYFLRHEGYSIREIAEKMERSQSSIKYKLYRKQEETK